MSHAHVMTDEKIKAAARTDAAGNHPATDATLLSPSEMDIFSLCEKEAKKKFNSKGIIGQLEQLDSKIKAGQEKLEQDFKTRVAQIEEDFKAACERNSACRHFKNAEMHHDRLAHAFNIRFKELNRMPYRDIAHWLYISIAILIGIGEVPLNAMVFRIFGDNELMTWVMSLIIGLILPFAAHFVGQKVRQHGEGFSLANALKACFFSAIIIGALYSITLMRQEYLHNESASIGLAPEVVSASFLFFWVNLAIFATAIVVAYMAHDPIPGYQQQERDLRKAEKALTRAGEAWDREGENIRRKKSEELAKAEKEKNSRQSDIKKIMGDYDKILREGQEIERYWQSNCQNGISVYRAENKRHRTDHAPQYFDDPIQWNLILQGYREKLDNNEGIAA